MREVLDGVLMRESSKRKFSNLPFLPSPSDAIQVKSGWKTARCGLEMER